MSKMKMVYNVTLFCLMSYGYIQISYAERYGPFYLRPRDHSDKYVSLVYSRTEEKGYLEVSNDNNTVFFFVNPALEMPRFSFINLEVVKYLNDTMERVENITSYVVYVDEEPASVITMTLDKILRSNATAFNYWSSLINFNINRLKGITTGLFFRKFINNETQGLMHYNLTLSTNLTYLTFNNILADQQIRAAGGSIRFDPELADTSALLHPVCPLQMEEIGGKCLILARNSCLNITEAANTCRALGYPGADLSYLDPYMQAQIFNNLNLPDRGRRSYWNVQGLELRNSTVNTTIDQASESIANGECTVITRGSPVPKNCSERTRFYCTINKGPYIIMESQITSHLPGYNGNDFDGDCNPLLSPAVSINSAEQTTSALTYNSVSIGQTTATIGRTSNGTVIMKASTENNIATSTSLTSGVSTEPKIPTDTVLTEHNTVAITNEVTRITITDIVTMEHNTTYKTTKITKRADIDMSNSTAKVVTHRRAKKIVFPVEEAFAAPAIGALPLMLMVASIFAVVFADLTHIIQDMRKGYKNVKLGLKKRFKV